MKRATRPGVHVDRAACAWLIRGLTSGSDRDTLTVTVRLFDSLYEYTRRRLMTGRPPA